MDLQLCEAIAKIREESVEGVVPLVLKVQFAELVVGIHADELNSSFTVQLNAKGIVGLSTVLAGVVGLDMGVKGSS